jgi:hypothetical protein
MVTLIFTALLLIWLLGAYSAYNAHRNLTRILGMRNKSKKWTRLVLFSWVGYLIIKSEEDRIFNRRF